MNALPFLLLALALPANATSNETSSKPGAIATRPSELSPVELAVWNEPGFRRQFQRSYAAVTDVEPTLTEDERETMIEIGDLIGADDLDGAAKKARKHSEKGSAVFAFTLGNIHFQRDELGPALEAYDLAIAKFENFRRAIKNKSVILVRQGSFEAALEPLRRVIELGDRDGVSYGLLGFAYANVENDLAAESAFRMANLLDPGTLDWKMGLARSFFKQQRFAEAASLCGQLIEEYPDRGDLWLLQANAFLGMNQPLRAAQNYELVDRLGKSTADSLNILGDIYVNEELYDLGSNAYGRALAKDAAATLPRALRAAKLMAARGEMTETRQLVETIEPHAEGAEVAASDADFRKDVLKLRARIAVAEGAGDEEARVLEEIVALDPLDGEALILLGRHAARNDDIEQAIFYFERAESLEAFEADAKIEHAQVLVRSSRYAEALPLLRRAQLLRPRDSVADYLAQVERLAQRR